MLRGASQRLAKQASQLAAAVSAQMGSGEALLRLGCSEGSCLGRPALLRSGSLHSHIRPRGWITVGGQGGM